MTHQNHQTNGASLEDCHTNFFSLTELYGIKWRKLVWGESPSGGGSGSGGGAESEGAAPLADPVISSYARCLAGDILCVWRRVPTHQPQDIYDTGPPQLVPPPLSLRAAKELWIFWYGEEPDLNGLVAPELIASQGEQGSWEGGLSYECRSLLFKALHNLIERCLLSRDFVRLGKWFVQPYDGDEEDVGKSPWHLSFSFAFFLHGESTVCASVDVRQHPPVRTLTPRRLARLARLARTARSEDQENKVILAPFGLEGTVTGREWSDADPATGRLLDAWRQLYPLEPSCGALEVTCGGVRMRYPAPYVLTTPPSPAAPAPAAPPGPALPAPPAEPLAERTARALTTSAPHLSSEQCVVECDKGEDFVDPTRKTPCTCAKWRRRRSARLAPFHRRAHCPRARHAAGPAAGATACSPGSCGGGSPAAPVSAPSSAGAPPASPPQHNPPHRTPQHQGGASVPTTLHTPAPTPDPLAPPTPAPPTKLFNQGESPRAENGPCDSNDASRQTTVPPRPALPPPAPRLDPLEDETSLHMLYDYTTVNAWLEHPVKRFKGSESVFSEEMALGAAPRDLYAGHRHTSLAAARPPPRAAPPQDDLKEYKNLFTSDGLCPTLKDLDQIFDNSDDASGDEAVRLLQVQTPPDSNKSMEEAATRLALGGGLPTELSKMFPTPPSLEAHAQPSPGFTLPDDERLACRAPPAAPASPPPDPIEDWSYVFKSPTVCKYVGSSKYAPLAVLPSQLLPPVPLPPAAVYRPRRPDQKRPPRDKTSGTKRSSSPPPSNRSSGPNSQARETSPPASPPPSPRAPPAVACPLLLNVLLADTVLNVFRDHNFDSCTVCVCHDGPNMVGNIRGADAATYLCSGGGSGESPPGSPAPPAAHELDHYIKCSCGFSAILNRRLAHRAGLFYEDEMEITGLAEEPCGSGSAGSGLADVVALVTSQCAALPGGSACALARAAARAARAAPAEPRATRLDLLEYSDGGAAAARALRAAGGTNSLSSQGPLPPTVHRWPFQAAQGPSSSRDVVRLMRRLRPLLQDAIQKRCCGARMWDGVAGPLTWRQFHRLAGRGNEDLCEPQPVPPLLVGHDSDWLSLSPYALRHWERLSLEPYSHSRDVAYIVVAPDAPALHDPLKAFFRDLSAAYEACRLGRHRPVTRLARDGIIRAAPSNSTSPDEWLGDVGEGKLGRYVRAYAEALRGRLVAQLTSLSLDRAFDEPPRAPVPQTDQEGNPVLEQSEPEPSALGGGSWAREEGGAPALVVYVVEPPGAGAGAGGAALLALLRLAARAQQALAHLNPLVKIISLEGVCGAWGLGGGGGGGGAGAGGARALALSVFTGCRRRLQHSPNGKSLTGFGTAADANLFISSKDEKNRAPYKLFTPAWVVGGGPRSRAGGDAGEAWGGAGAGGAGAAVLFLSYCLSRDQRWLLAAVSDARGELLETAAINVHVPARSRRRRGAPARRLGLTKLMDFTLGVMSQAAQPWRLVVGRIGRIGHGELKGWSWLLSRKNLVRASSQLRAACGSCNALYPHGAPCILSACLVSTEPDSRLRLMADRFTPDERFSQHTIHSHLHTPRDVTATHILVFPTSATTTSTQTQFEQPAAGDDNDMFDLDIEMPDEEMEDDNLLFLKDSFLSSVMWGAPGSPPPGDLRAEDEEPRGARLHDHSFARADDHNAEAIGNVLQQPLALGYLVSTAPLGAMPSWWWGSSGHLRNSCPAFLKNALHLHSLASGDDLAISLAQTHHTHPLDSQLTTDVLRYVLEGYNNLSWLALDGATHDRLSCLPLHVQALMQLYHTAAALP